MCASCSSLIKAIDAYIAKADDDLADQLKAAGFQVDDDTMKAIQSLEDEIAEALVEETAVFTKAADSALDLQEFAEKIWPDIKLTDALAVTLSSIFAKRFEELMPGLVEAYLQMTDRELHLEQVSKMTMTWVQSWSEQLGEVMKLNSHKAIEQLLTDGLKNGSSISEFTQSILDSGIRNEYRRARTVSVTEVLRAHSAAQQEAFMQSPAVTRKKWRHSGPRNNNARRNHVAMDGKVVDKDKPFTLKGADGSTYHPMYPRDPSLPAGESANCHCLDEPVVDDEILGLSLEERQELQRQAVADMDDEWERALDEENKAKAGIEEA